MKIFYIFLIFSLLFPTYSFANNENPLVCLDPGHQKKWNYSTEAIWPKSAIKKPKVTTGATGIYTRKPESVLMLEIAKKLQKELKNRNYNVALSRESQSVNISNQERAKWANAKKCDIYIRLHADSSKDPEMNGVSIQTISAKNPFIPHLYEKNKMLSEKILEKYILATGLKNNGIVERDDLSGTNWTKIPTTLIEFGFLSNKAEDQKLSDAKFQEKMITGVANGVDAYFEGKNEKKFKKIDDWMNF